MLSTEMALTVEKFSLLTLIEYPLIPIKCADGRSGIAWLRHPLALRLFAISLLEKGMAVESR
jgi:hypothetical protein